MKRFFGLVAAAMLLNTSANAAVVTAVADKALATETIQAVQAFKAIVSGGIKTPADLVAARVAGITAESAPALFTLVSPLVAAFNAQKGVSIGSVNAERLAALANEANLKPTAAISAMTEQLTAKGNLDEQSLIAAFAATGKNVANLLPGAISKMNTSEILSSYVATTADVQGMMSESASVEEMNAQGEILKAALVDAPAIACAGLSPAACTQVTVAARSNAENFVALGYAQHGLPAVNFFVQAHTGFPGEETGAAPADYVLGYGSALNVVGTADGAKVTPASKDLHGCLVGKPQVSDAAYSTAP